ncbi:MAG: PaaI family thioesterase [Roseobacter sp.]
MTLKMTLAELEAFVAEAFEQVQGDFTVLALTEDTIEVRLNVTHKHLRPGGTVSGPTMFSLADVTAYYMTLARIGAEALTVTTNCSIDFMRKPVAGVDLIAKARLLKLGRQLSVTDVLLYSDGSDLPVARATLTYSIPPVPRS